jgi:hypothetical protein
VLDNVGGSSLVPTAIPTLFFGDPQILDFQPVIKGTLYRVVVAVAPIHRQLTARKHFLHPRSHEPFFLGVADIALMRLAAVLTTPPIHEGNKLVVNLKRDHGRSILQSLGSETACSRVTVFAFSVVADCSPGAAYHADLPTN